MPVNWLVWGGQDERATKALESSLGQLDETAG
jgi:hypothetical protein